MSRDDEQIGSLEHGGSLPDSSTSDQIDAAALRAALRDLTRRGGEAERPRLIVELGHERALIKAIDRDQLHDRAFVLSRPLDGLRLRLRTQIFAHAGQLYELVRLDPRLRPATASELDPLFMLYEQAERICMLAPFVELDALLRGPHINKDIDRGDGHPEGPSASLDGVLAAIEPTLGPLRPATDAGLRRGLVHGDLHRHNLMVPRAGDGPAVLIDLDPIFHSYAALNLAHLCIDEYVAGAGRHAELPGFRARVLARLAPADAAAFDYLVLVELFRMLVKRAFHRQHYSEDWEDELLFLFEGYGVDTYLARVRGASSA
ncbi:phosphotransferase [Enhygromyxa salina]|uniref:phosphotransferase n=1 Tax=Enhygromyxa salina TaxID=215803 RepID=UPI0015E5C3E2|nr:phosphotransferase [Enhygromyxa salina]